MIPKLPATGILPALAGTEDPIVMVRLTDEFLLGMGHHTFGFDPDRAAFDLDTPREVAAALVCQPASRVGSARCVGPNKIVASNRAGMVS